MPLQLVCKRFHGFSSPASFTTRATALRRAALPCRETATTAPARPAEPLVTSLTILLATDPLSAAAAYIAARPALAAARTDTRFSARTRAQETVHRHRRGVKGNEAGRRFLRPDRSPSLQLAPTPCCPLVDYGGGGPSEAFYIHHVRAAMTCRPARSEARASPVCLHDTAARGP